MTAFLDRAFRFADTPSLLQSRSLAATVHVWPLGSFATDAFAETLRKRFDRSRPVAPTFVDRGRHVEVSSPACAAHVRWPDAGMAPTRRDPNWDPDLLRATCGEDGFPARLGRGTASPRIAVYDRGWRPVALLDPNVPELDDTGDLRTDVLGLRQMGGAVVLEAIMRRPHRTSAEADARLVRIRAEDPAFVRDVGGGATPGPSLAEAFLGETRP